MQKIKNKIYPLLRWSEKYFKTDMVYLARGGFWLTLGQIVSSISSFLLAIAFANLLPKETFGTYKYILSIAGILAIPTLSGMNTAIVQAVARGFEGSFVLAIKTKIRWGLLGGLASLCLAGYYFYQDNTTLTISFLISAVFLPFMDSFGIYDSLLQGRKLFNVSTKYGIVSQIIAIATLIATLFFTKNLFLILLAYFASWTILRFIFFKITLKKFQPNTQQDPQTISYGKHLSLMNIIGIVAYYLDRLLIFHFLGATNLAIYYLAIAPPEQIKGLFKSFPSLALPKFSEREKGEIKKGMRRKVILSILAILIIIAVYILFAPLIYKIFFPKYMESVFYSQIYAISVIATVYLFPYAALQAQIAKKELYYFNIATSVLQIGLLVVMIYCFGIMGAVLSRLISRFAILFYSMWLVKRM